MRKVLAISFSLLVAALIGYVWQSARRAWPPKHYTEVRAFLYNLDNNSSLACVTNGQLDASMTDTNGVRLSDMQVARLFTAITGKHPEIARAQCYVPHHAYIFYDQQHQIVGWVELCFGCLRYKASSPDAPPAFDLPALADLTRELGLPILKDDKDYQALKEKDTK